MLLPYKKRCLLVNLDKVAFKCNFTSTKLIEKNQRNHNHSTVKWLSMTDLISGWLENKSQINPLRPFSIITTTAA